MKLALGHIAWSLPPSLLCQKYFCTSLIRICVSHSLTAVRTREWYLTFYSLAFQELFLPGDLGPQVSKSHYSKSVRRAMCFHLTITSKYFLKPLLYPICACENILLENIDLFSINALCVRNQPGRSHSRSVRKNHSFFPRATDVKRSSSPTTLLQIIN